MTSLTVSLSRMSSRKICRNRTNRSATYWVDLITGRTRNNPGCCLPTAPMGTSPFSSAIFAWSMANRIYSLSTWFFKLFRKFKLSYIFSKIVSKSKHFNAIHICVSSREQSAATTVNILRFNIWTVYWKFSVIDRTKIMVYLNINVESHFCSISTNKFS